MTHNLFYSLQQFQYAGKSGEYYSLPALENAGLGKISRPPVSLRVVLESALRNCDGKKDSVPLTLRIDTRSRWTTATTADFSRTSYAS